MASMCRCVFDCPDGRQNGTCFLEPGGYCYAFLERVINPQTKEEFNEYRYGCFPPTEGTLMQCKAYKFKHETPKTIGCCKDEDFCNTKLELQLNLADYETPFDWREIIEENQILITWMLASMLMATFLFIFAFLFRKYHNNKYTKDLDPEKKFLSKPSNSIDYPYMDCSSPMHSNNFFEKHSSGYESNVTLLSQPKNMDAYHCHSDSSGISSGCSSGSNSSQGNIGYARLHGSHSSSNNTTTTLEHTSRTTRTMLPSGNYSNSSSSNYSSHTVTSSLGSENTQQTTLSASNKHTFSSSLPPVNECEATSGSGSGGRTLVQKTLSKTIKLEELIGTGHFGRVWRGVRQCENVAVKIFLSKDEASWNRELDVYTKVNLSHEFIVNFLGADVASEKGCTMLWLVTVYHPLGSLYDYLNKQPVSDPMQMLQIMKSIVFGIGFLHAEVIGSKGKPAIAHRDIKSKNILMKSPNSCCIADFGLAIINGNGSTSDHVDVLRNNRVGTKRYMAPEILSNSMAAHSFSNYQMADIYSLGLVFWEIVNRVNIQGTVNAYIAPYEEFVPRDPTFEEMRTVVCDRGVRPQFPWHFQNFASLEFVVKMISECWLSNPSARLTALRIKKDLLRIIELHQGGYTTNV